MARVIPAVFAKVRYRMAVRHYVWALIQDEQARLIEEAGKPSPGATERHDAAVLGCLFESVAFLEAGVNELFADAEDHVEALAPVPAPVIKRWAAASRKPLRLPASTLLRCQLALVLADVAPFEPADPTYAAAELVINVRNRFVHYEPQWLPAGDEANLYVDQGSLEKRLMKAGIERSPFSAAGDPFFPLGCVSHSCAIWSIRSVAAFSDAFRARLGLPIGRSTEEEVRKGWA